MSFDETIKELRNHIYEKNINFLFGAGASTPYFSSLGYTEEIMSNTDFDNRIKPLIYYYYFIKSIKKNMELLHDKNECEYGITQHYVSFIEKLAIRMGIRNDRISPKRANVFTTNYDIFFERAVNIVQQLNPSLIVNDGGHGYFNRYLSAENFHKTVSRNGVFDNYHKEISSINLIKCHGSVTWEKSDEIIEDRIEIRKDLDLLMRTSYLADKVILNEDDLKTISLFLSEKEIDISQQSELLHITNKNTYELNLFFEEYKKIMIINPEKTKFYSTVMEEHYYSMLRFLSYELEKEQTVLIVFGFSFADEHIRNLIKRSVHNPYLKIYVFAYSENSVKVISDLLNGSKQSNITIIGPGEEMQNIDFKQFNKLLFGEN